MKPLLSILVPTMLSRSAFWPWLHWNLEKQVGLDWSRIEVLVQTDDASIAPFGGPRLPLGAHGLGMSPIGTTIGAKRNVLLRMAQGKYVAWFDDDDWHHPERLVRQLDALASQKTEASFTAWRCYLDLETEKGVELSKAYRTKANAMTFVGSRELALKVPFPEQPQPGEDTVWLRYLETLEPHRALLVEPKPLMLGLLHEGGITRPITRQWRLDKPAGHWERVVGEDAWGDTNEQLRALRARLGTSP